VLSVLTGRVGWFARLRGWPNVYQIVSVQRSPPSNWMAQFRDRMRAGKFLNNPRSAELHAKEEAGATSSSPAV
jgi:hypothetical protein